MAEEYKSNSHKSKKQQKDAEKKKENKTKDDTRAKLLANREKEKPKKPEKKNVTSIIFADIKSICVGLIEDSLIPGMIDLSYDMCDEFIDNIYESVIGRPKGNRSHKRKGSKYHAYDGDYRKNKRDKDYRRSKKPKKISYGRYSIYEVPCKSEAFAEDVIDAIFEQFDEYEHCSVKDYYDFADFNDWEYTDYPDDWGWELDDDGEYPFDPDDLEIESYRDGNGDRKYTITGFTKPVRLD